MAAVGATAATAWLRYENLWVVWSALDVLNGKARHVLPHAPEGPKERTDFLVLEDGAEVWHWVKYGSHPWSISRLAKEGVLSTCWAKLQDGGYFALDVGANVPHLAELTDAARSAPSWPDFDDDYLHSKRRLQVEFRRLVDEWGCVPHQGYESLKRITVNCLTPEKLAIMIEARMHRMMAHGSPAIAGMLLERLVEESPGRPLGDDDLREYLAGRGLVLKDAGTLRAPRLQGRRAVAGVRSDSPSPEDMLGVGSDVETLAELIAATATQPPLAIALIGDWGIGKSSLMLQVEREIGRLAAASRGNTAISAFAGNVRQVRFNAWHYSDDQVWTGLIGHLFQVLASAAPDPSATAPDTTQIQESRDRLRKKVAAKEKECKRLDAALAAADRQARPTGLLAGLGSPGAMARNVTTVARLAFEDLRTSLATLAIWTILLGIAWVLWHFLAPWAGVIVAAGGTLAAPFISTLKAISSWHHKVIATAAQLHDMLVARQHHTHEELRSLREQLALIDAATRLSSFLDERSTPAAYGSYQGLLGRVRADLEQLSETLAQARDEWTADGSRNPAPLERIVLYIDDLDRCTPKRVVEVLEAVHLMLALDLFVVVVAVDARWLIRSLEYHHHDLFSTGSAAADGFASPVDYLDKIFQIPYVVLPPSSQAIGRYLQRLLSKTESTADNIQTALPSSAPQFVDANSGLPEDGARDWRQAGTGDPREDESGRTTVSLEEERTSKPDDGLILTDLRPPGLELTRAETEFMARLGGLLATPRAAKRMVNIYRLVRIGIPDEELEGFIGDEKGGPYQASLVLLAILTGSPTAAEDVFRVLMNSPPGESMLSALQEITQSDSSFQEAVRKIESELITLEAEAGLTLTVSDCQHWCPALARFSFHTRGLASSSAGPAPDAHSRTDSYRAAV